MKPPRPLTSRGLDGTDRNRLKSNKSRYNRKRERFRQVNPGIFGSVAGRVASRLPVESSLDGEFAFGAVCADFPALPFEGEVEGAVHAEAASEPAVSAVGVGSSEGSAGGERSSVPEHAEPVARFRFESELASGIRGAEFRRSLAVPQGPGLRYAEIVRTAVTRRFLRFSSANML